MSETRCPECQCLLKDKDLKNDKCWKCGFSPVREIIEKLKEQKKQEGHEKEKSRQKKFDKFAYNLGKKYGKRQNDSESNITNSYPALKAISFIYLISAWLVVIGAIIGLFYNLYLIGDDNIWVSLILVLRYLLFGLFGFISFLALSEGIKLFVNIANDLRELKINKKNN